MVKNFSKDDAKKELLERAKNITEEDLEKVLQKQEEIRKKFETGGPLGRYIDDVKLLFSLIKDYFNGSYRKIPWFSIAAIIAALFYVLNPIDVIPDFIPVIGYLDDLAVMAVCLNFVEQDLHKYKKWKINNM
ncbi:YkvA family protein [Hydrogenothermus marinus]|uniref:Uncharacterized membrane protein YkvA (DUF1232 family) n=1 Tax=Hydrogenothermus marinus TaxID=133270 RepID=A0A3M0BDN5_9AQUI|nr:uncharacterized membrane protein YkvA (DUF1232 family) [Hydrogenothermus marinus]